MIPGHAFSAYCKCFCKPCNSIYLSQRNSSEASSYTTRFLWADCSKAVVIHGSANLHFPDILTVCLGAISSITLPIMSLKRLKLIFTSTEVSTPFQSMVCILAFTSANFLAFRFLLVNSNGSLFKSLVYLRSTSEGR